MVILTTLRVKDLTKRYGNVTALEKFSLEISSGEFMVLLGPSGCGKTTVIRCIAGLTNPSDGEIYIGNELVNDLPPKDRDVAMVFQNYSLYPHMNVYDNIAFPLKMRKTERHEIDERVTNIAELLNIRHLLNRKPREISGGQMQRVALGRALVRKPRIFLMDEPLSNLDAKLRTDMRVEIKKLQRKLHITTLYITHDQVEAMSMADNIGVMESGKLQQLCNPDEIYNNPVNQFVASFIGMPPMNFLECSLVRQTSQIFFTFASGSEGTTQSNVMVKVPDNLSNRLCNFKEQTVILGVRPRDLQILKPNQDFEGLNLIGEVTFMEMLGDESIAEVRLGGDSIKISNVNPNSENLTIGKEVRLGINQNKVYLFTKAGNRIMGEY
jgi:multiple sugar transport system ATP-binding protein